MTKHIKSFLVLLLFLYLYSVIGSFIPFGSTIKIILSFFIYIIQLTKFSFNNLT